MRTIVVFLLAPPLTALYATRAYFAGRKGGERALCACEALARRWARIVLRLAGASVRFEGLDCVDWERPLVVVANHQSWFDVFALVAYLPAHVRFVAKQELGRIPIFGPAWKACGHVSIDRSDQQSAVESLVRAARKVPEDRAALVLFPEGTRSPDGRLGEFKKGAFVLAISTGVAVVPVGISGSREIMAKGSFRIRSGEIRVRVGRPIPVEGLVHEDRDQLMARGRAAVAELMEHPEGAAEDAGPVRGASSGRWKGEGA